MSNHCRSASTNTHTHAYAHTCTHARRHTHKQTCLHLELFISQVHLNGTTLTLLHETRNTNSSPTSTKNTAETEPQTPGLNGWMGFNVMICLNEVLRHWSERSPGRWPSIYLRPSSSEWAGEAMVRAGAIKSVMGSDSNFSMWPASGQIGCLLIAY